MKVKRGTDKNRNNVGIHLYDPSKAQIQNAKEDAVDKGFPAVYVHRTRTVVVKGKRR